MKLLLFPLAALAALALALSVAVVAQGSARDGGSVYEVAALRSRLDHQPDAWVGRTVLVRAIAGQCTAWVGMQGSTCVAWSSELLDASSVSANERLPLAVRRLSPLQALLRRIPLVGHLAPALPVVYWGVAAVYQVQLRAVPCTSHHQLSCYGALLLDSVPELS